eukprot:CAMPEP_0114449792 /NCGR_PEP_ID=MMETSP0104-20121206/122_1 /TAXON_ID=37642 ORGANISM="Paraphysomonas imperforata, Strain PA2" /NCGR_SAMPLE_ID=MMETSP0104 /ASSEMBLY_ACC=CAM_ASM_000202 /LENGTH=295 /DNA_ID=CAMNT_0001621903 /DNA_START=113 /DNA_END=1000 /DNA_ORIENTATION=+
MAVLDVEVVLFDVGLYYPLFAFLDYSELVKLETVNHQFHNTIRQSEPTWRITSEYLIQNKVYVPKIVQRFLTDGNTISARKDLMAMSIKELKSLARQYALNLTTCFEKSDIINVINRREIRQKLPVECLARFAVRYACVDSTRNVITEEELVSMPWSIRIKEFGQLSHLLAEDPWWNGSSTLSQGTTTTIYFQETGSFRFEMSGPSPFDSMMPNLTDENQASFMYDIRDGGRSVYLSFGVNEVVFRHPDNWGFMLGSGGSVWSGFPMPRRGADPRIEDPAAEALRVKDTDFGMRL